MRKHMTVLATIALAVIPTACGGADKDATVSAESVAKRLGVEVRLTSDIKADQVCFQLSVPRVGDTGSEASADNCVPVASSDTITSGNEGVSRLRDFRYLVGVAAPGITRVVAHLKDRKIESEVRDQAFALVWPGTSPAASLEVFAGDRRVDNVECNSDGC